MKAIVKEIQVCGGKCVDNLEDACIGYLLCSYGDMPRTKLNFTIVLPNKEVKSITIRQEDDEIVAYGDFEELPSMLDYAKEILGDE